MVIVICDARGNLHKIPSLRYASETDLVITRCTDQEAEAILQGSTWVE